MSRSSAEAVALILKEESFTGHPYWPGGMSGVTLDPGYDLCSHDVLVFRHDWIHLGVAERIALEVAIGYRGQGAKVILDAHNLAAIAIPRDVALEVFADDSLPTYEQDVLVHLPGSEFLPADAFGALTSCVYNRGSAMEGDRRLELRAIRSAVAAFAATQLPSTRVAALQAMAHQLDAMGTRLWPTDWMGLRTRRHAEADLVRRAASALAQMAP